MNASCLLSLKLIVIYREDSTNMFFLFYHGIITLYCRTSQVHSTKAKTLRLLTGMIIC